MNFRLLAGLALAPLAALAAPPTHAQSSLPDVVVSASRTAQRVQDALPATTVITREQIERSLAVDLSGVLSGVAGVEIARSGGIGTQTGVYIRGAESRHTLVLVDGVPVNNLNFGLPALEHLPLADIERIEVVRGNVSSLYGSAAVGGLIQIFTREGAQATRASVGVQAGSRGQRRLEASASTRLASGTRLSASLESLEDAGYNALRQDQRPGTDPDRDGYVRRAAGLGLSQELGGGHTVGLRVRESRGTTRYDSEFGPANQADESRFVERGAIVEGRFRLGSAVTLDASASTATDLLDADVTAYPYWVRSRSHGTHLGLVWQVAPGRQLTAGVEHTRQSLSSDTVYNQSGRTVDSARAGYSADAGAHQIQLNVRNDRYSDFGSAGTALAAWGYRLGGGWRASVMASTGFNAPTFNDLYYPWGGNAALRPEHVRSAEIGLSHQREGSHWRATVFNQRYTDLIGYDAGFNRVNIGRARNRGLELAWEGRLGGATVRADLTHQQPVDLDTGARLSRRASTLAHAAYERQSGAMSWAAEWRYSGARPDGSQELGAYTLVDLRAGWRLSRQWRLDARLDNLFDREWQSVYGYRQPGRGVFAGLRWQDAD